MDNYAEKVEAVLERYGWSHGKATGPGGEKCLLVASWTVPELAELTASHNHWISSLVRAARTLFPERIRPAESMMTLNPAGQVSDHPDTTREDISLILKHAQAYMEETDGSADR